MCRHNLSFIFNHVRILLTVELFLKLFSCPFSELARLLAAQTVSSSWSFVHQFPSSPTPPHSRIGPPLIKAAVGNTTTSGNNSCPTHLHHLITRSLRVTWVPRHPHHLHWSPFPGGQTDASLSNQWQKVPVPLITKTWRKTCCRVMVGQVDQGATGRRSGTLQSQATWARRRTRGRILLSLWTSQS